MIQQTICFFAALNFFMLTTTAQKQEVNSIEWKVAGVLPATYEQQQALGLAGPVAGVHNDVLIVAGGANFPDAMPWLGGKKKYYDDVYVMKRKNDSLVHYKTFKLPFSVAYSATISTSDGVLSVGGENQSGISDKVFLIQWNTDADGINIKQLPSLPFAVTNASVVSHNNTLYLAGGETIHSVSNNFLVLDRTEMNAGWKRLPSLPKLISHAVMVVQSNGSDDCIYLIGGRKKNPGSSSDLYSSTLQFNITSNQWAEKKSLPYALSAGTGIATRDNNILLFGGDAGETFHKTEKLIAAISKEKDEQKKQELNDEKTRLQSSHPGFCGQVFLYNSKKDDWKKLNCIPFDVPVTTTAIQWNNDVLIPSGEIKAGVRTPHVLLAKFN